MVRWDFFKDQTLDMAWHLAYIILNGKRGAANIHNNDHQGTRYPTMIIWGISVWLFIYIYIYMVYIYKYHGLDIYDQVSHNLAALP